tara:strand:- start:58 stop:387 length:330 start_codon:yes stop_codon:yes gene_type:complete
MNFKVDIKPWFGVFVAFFATFFWRFLGLILAERMSSTGLLMRWINAVAYSMVAGVLMLILVNPTGILQTSNLMSRLLALFLGILAIYFSRNILFSITVGIGSFVIFTRL